MQPTFLPWLGYFSLIESVDQFVFLDVVQFESRSWQQRNRILINNQPAWLTIPTSLPQGRSTPINRVIINLEHYSGESVLKTLRQAYGKKPGFNYVETNILKILLTPPSHLSTLNITLIKEIAFALEIDSKFICASDLNISGRKADLLLSICKELGASTYVSPVGSKVYLEAYEGFINSRINLEYQDFNHPIYSQGSKDFISHLSILDVICNLSLETTRNLIRLGETEIDQ